MTRSSGQRTPKPRPGAGSLFEDEWHRLLDILRQTVTDDPVTSEAIDQASAIAARSSAAPASDGDDPDLEQLIRLTQLVRERLLAPERLGRFVPLATFERILYSLITREPVGGADDPLRFLELPSVPGRVVWALYSEADVQALRAAIEPGQVWVRADLVGSDQWPLVRAAAAINVRLAGRGRRLGRPPGRGDPEMQAVIDAVAARPDMTKAEIIELAQPMWTKRGLADDYDAIGRRVRRIRERARSSAGRDVGGDSAARRLARGSVR